MSSRVENNESRKLSGGGWTLFLAFLLTVGWFAGGGWFLLQTQKCATPELWFPLSHTKCLTPNEFGDLLAGMFAPVAFIWVAAAVMLQRGELAAQRQELSDSRAVAKEQVEEARKNVEFIGEQTEIFRQQRWEAESKIAEEGVLADLRSIRRIIQQEDTLVSEENTGEPWNGPGINITLRWAGRPVEDGEGELIEVESLARGILASIMDLEMQVRRFSDQWNGQKLKKGYDYSSIPIEERLNSIESVLPLVGKRYESAVRSMNIEHLIQVVDQTRTFVGSIISPTKP